MVRPPQVGCSITQTLARGHRKRRFGIPARGITTTAAVAQIAGAAAMAIAPLVFALDWNAACSKAASMRAEFS
jgi:hypothetical protein